MDATTLVNDRCGAIGLPAAAPAHPTATIRANEARPRASIPTLASERPPSSGARELPRISVEIRGTLSEPELDRVAQSGRERDLEVIRTLGEGGMGRVFLARQHSLDRDVAIKTVRDSSADPQRTALLAEGAITGHLEHPAVVPVHALGVDEDGRPVLVMKCVDGAPWFDLIANVDHPAWRHLGGGRHDRLDQHLEILTQVCNAVDFAHSRKILHRDIKPQNVLIGRYGEVYLADWGLALRFSGASQPQPLCGTPAYMAPEMVMGDPVDARTDVFLLGATLHEVLTGSPRHDGDTVKETLAAAFHSLPVVYPPSVPDALAALANAATAADPADRPATAAAFRERIADYTRHKSSVALARSAAERIVKLREMFEQTLRLGSLGSETFQRDVDRLSAQAGFALDEALREWPENVAARKSQADLDALLATRRSRAAELERLARELDPGVSYRQRMAAFGAMAFVGMGLSVSAFFQDGRDLTTRGLLFQSLGPLGIVLVLTQVLRRSLMRTLLNRRVTFGMVVVTAAIAMDRALGMLAGVSSGQVLVFDCLIGAVAAALSTAYVFRWLAWPSVMMLGGAIWAAASPAHAMSAFSAASGLAFLTAVLLAWKSDGGPEPAPRSR